ncbi:MAG: hypothetical protein NPINA01_00840 [Nitrospinaceae bacterium]|nr:MAG: hypothetical protein NPINA01_00840 [Nitrospinaceae bacterium]
MTSNNTISRRSPLLIPLLTLLLFGLGFASKISAQTLYVKKSGTKLQASESARSQVLTTLNQGTPVQVVKKGKRFYQVSAGGKTGWVFKFRLSATAPQKSGGDAGLLGALGGRQKIAAKEASSGSSIRGLSPIAEKHAKKKGISETDIKAVKQMEAFRIDPKELDKFLKEGKLGEYGQ